ncbi:glycoside hydrolase family 15 protein [Micromonospora sp. NPDC005254]|uniref:glycoside hydrolase family 15 protein n=1 Tax=Micromonospora sp. NPDC005254 TaxID=3364229 RepID=UPI0036C1C090
MKSICPEVDFTVERCYLDGTLVLRTVFHTAQGEVELTDALALEPGAGERPGGGRRGQPARPGQWPAADLRRGRGHRDVHRPRRHDPQLHPRVRPDLRRAAPQVPEADRTIADTAEGWRSWGRQHAYNGIYAEHVRRSALVVQGMTYRPSGAVVASVTTSLPEKLGGDRNYDYRYVWVRDFSLTLRALWRTACYDEVQRQFAWLGRAMGRIDEEPVPIMYGVLGERDLTEHRLDQLAGYRDSPPVMIGNDAWRQRQTDIFGEALDAAWLMRDRLEPLEPDVYHLLRSLADKAERDWKLPDAGMWGERGIERHHVSSKVQCWSALDRAVRFGERLGQPQDVARWAAARDEVRAEVLQRGWSDRLGAYTGSFESDDLDASVLVMPLVGFLPADDERMRSTVRAVEAQLSHDGLLRRWNGDPAGFLICSFWLVCCLALAGERDRAHELFDALAGRVNDLGLFAEQVDPSTGEQLGNFPQAFSHIGLINAAGVLSDVEQNPGLGRRGMPPGYFTPTPR